MARVEVQEPFERDPGFGGVARQEGFTQRVQRDCPGTILQQVELAHPTASGSRFGLFDLRPGYGNRKRFPMRHEPEVCA